MRLVIVKLAVNIAKLQSVISEDNFFCWVYNNFCSKFLLYNVIDFVSMSKSIVESCVDKKFLDRLSSFERCWSSLLCLLIALQRSLLQIDRVSLLETFSSLKLLSAIFYQIFIFSSSDRPSKTMKNVFCSILKALFDLEIFKFLYFFPFLSTLSRFQRANGSGIIYDVINWLA